MVWNETVVMAGLVPAIHALAAQQDVDARDEPAHDAGRQMALDAAHLHRLLDGRRGFFAASARTRTAMKNGFRSNG